MGKSLLSEALTNNGAYFADIDGWNFTQQEKKHRVGGTDLARRDSSGDEPA